MPGNKERRYGIDISSMSEMDQIALALRRSMEDAQPQPQEAPLSPANVRELNLPEVVETVPDSRVGEYIDMIVNMFPGVAHVNRRFVTEALLFLDTCARARWGAVAPDEGSVSDDMGNYTSMCKAIIYVMRRLGLVASMDSYHMAFALHMIQIYEPPRSDVTFPLLPKFNMPWAHAIAYTTFGARFGRDVTKSIFRYLVRPIRPYHNLSNCYRLYKTMTPLDMYLFRWIMSLNMPKGVSRHRTLRNRMDLKRIASTYVQDMADELVARDPALSDTTGVLDGLADDNGRFDLNKVQKYVAKSPVYNVFIALSAAMTRWGFRTTIAKKGGLLEVTAPVPLSPVLRHSHVSGTAGESGDNRFTLGVYPVVPRADDLE